MHSQAPDSKAQFSNGYEQPPYLCQTKNHPRFTNNLQSRSYHQPTYTLAYTMSQLPDTHQLTTFGQQEALAEQLT